MNALARFSMTSFTCTLLACGSSPPPGSATPSGDDGGAPSASDGSAPTTGTDGGSAPGTPMDAGPPPPPPTGAVTFTIDVAKGPARQFHPASTPQAVSPYVYGINGFGNYVKAKTKWGLIRQGGDAYSAWNWATNYGNSGADYCYWQGLEGTSAPTVAGAILSSGDSLTAAQAKGEAYLVTVPILEHVSGALSNNTGINNLCPAAASDCKGGSTQSYAANSGNLDFVSSDPNSAAFVGNQASKPGGAFCTCPGPACGSGCTVAPGGTVYEDEFANYVKVNYGGAGKPPIFLMLDNEPNYWGGTHPELWPFTGTVPCEQATVTFDDVVTRDKTFATALKAAWPDTKVFGPVVAQDGILYAHDYTDAHLPQEFADYYLAQMAAAGAAAGQPILDAFDVHYYNSGSTDPAQCVQNPRMFWDPGYTSLSAAATDTIDFGWSGPNGYFDSKWYPRQVIPRLLGKIDAAYASGSLPAPGLSFSEYNSGCETQIAGGVAEADNLGIFGREGVFAATAWPLQGSSTTNYLVAAFDSYRNYDGQGTAVGDTAVSAATNDPTKTSVYAFAHSDDPAQVDLVFLNKTNAAITAGINVAHAPAATKASLYHLVNGQLAVVATGTTPLACSGGSCSLTYAMPAMSVTTLTLR
ncbi:MAG TPA: glycoside hydrolase family 44 protein [Polyangiaceae bacterium]|jgi:hypothetical protein